MANAKKKDPAKPKASPRAQLKKKTPASKSSKKAAPTKAVAKKPVAKKAVAKNAPAKQAAAKPKVKVVAKKVATQPTVKQTVKAKTAATKPTVSKPAASRLAPPKATPAVPAAKTAAPQATMKKPEPPKVAAAKPTAVAKPAPTPAKTVKKESVASVKDISVRKKVSETKTPPAQIARAATAVAKSPSHDNAQPINRPRLVNLDDVKLPSGYVPGKDEEYMNPMQLLYFRNKLRNWRDELITESQETLDHLRSEIRDVGDEAERASRESDNILELRTRDRYRKLLKKIDDAIKRIDDGSYGFCEETGEDIGLARLEARPIATLTVDAQERRELFQKQFRDDR